MLVGKLLVIYAFPPRWMGTSKLNYKLIEEIFFNEPLLVVEDFGHSNGECRCIAFGMDNRNRKIMVVFTTRDNLIRVISAREMNKKEKKLASSLGSLQFQTFISWK